MINPFSDSRITMNGYDQPTRQANINGKIVRYDVCGCGDLDSLKKFYGEGVEYIGKGRTYYINGQINIAKEDHHFFIKHKIK